MNERITLTNMGRRRIEYAQGGYFKPGESTDFPSEIALRLLKLYPLEVRRHGDNLVAFAGDKKKEDFVPETTEQLIARKVKEHLSQHEADSADLNERRKALEAEKIAFEQEKEAAQSEAKEDKKARRAGNKPKEEEII